MDGHAVVGVVTDVLVKVGDGERGVGRIKLDSEAAGLAEDVELEDGDVVLEIRDERAVLVGLLLSYEDDFRDFWDHACHFAHGAAAVARAAHGIAIRRHPSLRRVQGVLRWIWSAQDLHP